MRRLYLYILASVLLAACNDNPLDDSTEVPAESIIQIGGIEMDELTVSAELTRANEGAKKDAEEEVWLRTPLKEGLDITYGKVNGTADEKAVAKLRLVADGTLDQSIYGTLDTEKGFNVKNGLAVYTFKTLNEQGVETTPAIWFGNGAHYFQGVYVPANIRYGTTNTAKTTEDIDKAGGTAPNLTTDLSATGDNSNFTLLERYLGMPANTRLSATIERIKLPFRHRLAHVIVYILIDPSISGATIKGYRGGKDSNGNFVHSTEDPKTSSILFRNVMMLKGVQDVYNETTKLHTLTPQWENFVPRVTPHFFGEHGSVYSNEQAVPGAENNFILFTHNRTKAAIFPTDDSKWDQIKTEWEGRKNSYLNNHSSEADKETKAIAYANEGTYTRVDYGLVPCYDIILRPTYTTEANVMYDEEGYSVEQTRKNIAALKNNIDFDIVLSNDLQYEKSVAIDLNANEETVVYLRISRESIDYNTSGAEKWIRDTANDGWYGLNNKNGNTLSKAGSSWQRAYTFASSDAFSETPGTFNGVTDGQFYNASSSHEERENAQYFKEADKSVWIEKFLQAYQGGEHHGDYFALKSNITIDARLIPENFVFTGHLDGQDKTIELTHRGEQVYKDAVNITPPLYTRTGTSVANWNYSAWNIPTLYVLLKTPIYYSDDELWEIDGSTYVKETLRKVDEQTVYYTTENEVNEANVGHNHEADDDHPEEWWDDGYPKEIGDVKEIIPEYYEVISTSRVVPVDRIKDYDITYPEASESTSPAYPTTLEQLKTNEYYKNNSGTERFTCPDLYQKSHLSPAYLFAGLNGIYTTAQESDVNAVWEANVHKETNKQTIWVPVAGYRAEVLNVKVAGGTMFKDEPTPYTGNVQNCFNGTTAIPNKTPALPQYK